MLGSVESQVPKLAIPRSATLRTVKVGPAQPRKHDCNVTV